MIMRKIADDDVDKRSNYLYAFYDKVVETKRFDYYIISLIYRQVYLDIIALIIRNQEYDKALDFIANITS